MYLGVNLLVQKKKDRTTGEVEKSRSAMNCFWQGALTNLLNPKTAAFMTSLFAVALPDDHSLVTGGGSVVLICIISAIWYSLVATLFSKKRVKNMYDNYKRTIERLAGGVFVLFGVKLAVSE